MIGLSWNMQQNILLNDHYTCQNSNEIIALDERIADLKVG